MNGCRVGRFDSERRTCDMINGVRIERDDDIDTYLLYLEKCYCFLVHI